MYMLVHIDENENIYIYCIKKDQVLCEVGLITV